MGRDIQRHNSAAGSARSSSPGCIRLTPWPVWRLIVGLILALVLLAVAVRGAELRQVWDGLRQADPIWVIVALLSFLLTTAAKIWRWHGLFLDTRQPNLLLLGRALLVGQLANALLPFRVGEVARAYMIGAGGEFSGVTALATIAAEKAFDVLFLLVSCGVAACLTILPPWLDLPLAGLAAGGLLLLILAASLPEQRILDWTDHWNHRLPWGVGEWLGRSLRRGLAGLAALRDPRMALTACAWSAVIWALAVGTNWLLFQAFDLALSTGAALLLLILLHVTTAPPSTPARLGVFHAFTLLGLTTFGVDRELALAYAMVLHAIIFLPQIVLGAIALIPNRGRVWEPDHDLSHRPSP